MSSVLCPCHLDIPRPQAYTGQAITQQRRLDLLRRFATSTTIPIRPRAAACLMLLYAQPLSRILRVSAADLTRDGDGQTWLHLGDPVGAENLVHVMRPGDIR